MSLHVPSGARTEEAPDWWLLLSKFLKQGTAIAALAPSSRWVARAAVAGIDFARARCVVELGAGTGPITRELLQHAGDCRVVVVERDHDFCMRLRQHFPSADVVESDAADLGRVLDERGIGQVDHIISGLPLPSFPVRDRLRVLAVIRRRLMAGGTFRQLTHMPWVYFKLYRSAFEEVAFRFVPLNLPPGGVYVCRRNQVPA